MARKKKEETKVAQNSNEPISRTITHVAEGLPIGQVKAPEKARK